MDEKPSANGDNGRDAQGRFSEGNPGGPGNPHAGQVAKLRSALLDAVSAEDVEAIIQAVLKRAKEGDLRAAKMLLDYSIGRPRPAAELPDESTSDMTKPPVHVTVVMGREMARGELLPGLPAPDAFTPEDDDSGEDAPGHEGAQPEVQAVRQQAEGEPDRWGNHGQTG